MRSAAAAAALAAFAGRRFSSASASASAYYGRGDALAPRLGRIVGDGRVSVNATVRAQHGQDEGPDKGAPPDVVVFPDNVGQVSDICRLCYEERVAVVPHGTGTGLEAGISALHGGVCVDLRNMAAIRDYHPDDFDAKVEPGVTREHLNHHVKDDGLWFPVDPGANASICGMCATGASGTNAVRYGTMRANCLNLEVVLADGRVVHTAGRDKRPRKSAAGYDLTGLMVGSEGTLGIITEATVRLHAQPESVVSAVVGFPDVASAVGAVVAALQCSMAVARVELLDEVAVRACNAYNAGDGGGEPLDERPTLFLEFHGGSAGDVESQASALAGVARDHGGGDLAYAARPEERRRLWTARHKLYYAALAYRPGSRSVTTDVCVPVSRLPEALAHARRAVDSAGITAPMFGHVGDGNFHALLLFDPGDGGGEYAACKAVAREMAESALRLGGTCTGEHGVGTGKIRLLERQMDGGAGLDVMAAIKGALDPRAIMNPGKVLRPSRHARWAEMDKNAELSLEKI